MEGEVTVGRVVKAHGLKGEVAVEVLSDVPGRFDPGVVLSGRGRSWTVAAARPHQGRLLVTFEGVADRTDAEGLRGLVLTAPAADTSDSETYYVHELVGLEVVDADDRSLGTVADHVELPAAAAYDLLEVERADGSRWLLPAVDAYVEVASLDGRDVLRLVDPPEGLVDPAEAETAGAPGQEPV